VSTDTTFSYQLRVAACDRCGAPCEATVAGGNFACRFCNAQNHLDVRDEALVAPTHAPISEMERIQRLRMQDGKPLLPPPSLMSLMPGGDLPDWKLNEAVAVWNSTRLELRAVRGNYDAAERLVFLTMVLAQRFQMKGDKLRQRSMLEGALDVVSLPRHRQILRGFLGRAAVRSGDLAAAEAWLKPCDPQSDDLQMDSAWRFTRAFIDTARGDFQSVLRVLGQGPQDVPIEDASDDVCATFRANAWEKLGRPDTAVMLLRERMSVGGGSGRQTIQRVCELYADWHLCTMSYPQAAAGYAAVAGQHAARRASGGIHVVFVPLGLLMLIGGVICLAILPLGIAGILDLDGGGYLGLGITGATLAFMGVVFFGIGITMKKSAEKAAWLRVHGIATTGRIQSVSPTGLSINDVPQVVFTVLVELPDRPPYQAHVKALMSGGIGRLAGGGSVPLRVHPQNPNEVLIELD
jgi:hypothetical protein